MTASGHKLDASRSTRHLTRWPSLIAMLVMLGTTIAFSWPALAPDRVFAAMDLVTLGPGFDQTDLATPRVENPIHGDHATQLVFPTEFWAAARDGDLQHWEPDIGGGGPLGTAIYNRVLSPFFVVTFSWLPDRAAITGSVMLMILVSQLGMWWFARRLGLGPGSATVAAVAYAFSGPSVSLLLRIHEVAWFPVVLALMHGVLTAREREPWWRIGLALSVAFLWFAGFPGGAVFAGVACATTAVVIVAVMPATTAERVRRLAMAGGLAAAGSLIAAVQLLPTAAFLDVTNGLERSYGAEARIGLTRFAEAVTPRFFGTFQDRTWWWASRFGGIGSGNTVQAATAFGAAALGCVGAVAFAGRRPTGFRQASLAAATLTLLGFSFAYFGGPVLWLYQQFPLLDASDPSRARFIAAAGVALLAGLGAEVLSQRVSNDAADRRAWTFVARLPAVVLLLIVGFAVARGWRLAGTVQQGALVANELRVPVGVLLAAVVVTIVLRRSRAGLIVLPYVLAVLAATELIVGHRGHQPAPKATDVWPTLATYADLPGTHEARFIAASNRPVFLHTTVPLDIPDARTLWPGTARYEDLLGLTDPAMSARSKGNGVTVGVPGPTFDPFHPALDRLAVRDILDQVGKQPLGLVADERVNLEAPQGEAGPVVSLPPLVAPDRAWRGVAFDVVGGACNGPRDVTAHRRGELVARWRRVVAGPERMRLALPDLDGGDITLAADGCDLAIADVVAEPGDQRQVQLVQVENWMRYQNVGVRPYVEVATDVQSVADPRERLTLLASESTAVLVDGPLPGAIGQDGSVEVLDADPDGATYRVWAEGGEVLLVVRENLAPGWTATIDGRAAEVIHADHAFRGVWVPPGEHDVTMRYVPAGFRTGLLLAALGLLVTWALAAAAPRERGPG